jgi:hypothetical protein
VGFSWIAQFLFSLREQLRIDEDGGAETSLSCRENPIDPSAGGPRVANTELPRPASQFDDFGIERE